MGEIKLVFEKEIKSYLKRKDILIWFIMINIFGVLIYGMTEADYIVAIFKKFDRPLEMALPVQIIVGLLFMSSIIPINITIEGIAGEREKKTLETLVTLPINLHNILIGKALNSMVLVLFSIVFMFSATTLYMINKGNGTLIDYFEIKYLGLVFFSAILNVIIINLVGTIVSILVKNLRVIGYIVLLNCVMFGAVLLFTLMFEVYQYLIYFTVFQAIVILVMINIIRNNVNKSYILKYI